MADFEVAMYFLGYSLFGAGAALMAKRAIGALAMNQLFAAALSFGAAMISLGLALVLLMIVLNFTPISILVPISVGLNLVFGSLAAIRFFDEHIDVHMVSGYVVIVMGIAILSTQNTA